MLHEILKCELKSVSTDTPPSQKKKKKQLLYKLLHMEKFHIKKDEPSETFIEDLTAVFFKLFAKGPQPIHNREWILWTLMLQNTPVVWRIWDLSVGHYFLGSVPY